MEQLTLQQLFGVNAYQDGQILIIQKSDLPGLTPSANNSAESLLVAILLVSWRNFQGVIEDENGISVTDENQTAISYDNSDIFEQIKLVFWRNILTNRSNNLYVTSQFVFETYDKYQWFT